MSARARSFCFDLFVRLCAQKFFMTISVVKNVAIVISNAILDLFVDYCRKIKEADVKIGKKFESGFELKNLAQKQFTLVLCG